MGIQEVLYRGNYLGFEKGSITGKSKSKNGSIKGTYISQKRSFTRFCSRKKNSLIFCGARGAGRSLSFMFMFYIKFDPKQ